ncbi:hypothetical protein GCM10020295_11160 [Streptomyces cinereospinus]
MSSSAGPRSWAWCCARAWRDWPARESSASGRGGLWAGVDIDPAIGTGRGISERLMREGVLVKDTHGSTIRLAPPLTVTAEELRSALQVLGTVLGRA